MGHSFYNKLREVALKMSDEKTQNTTENTQQVCSFCGKARPPFRQNHQQNNQKVNCKSLS